MIDLQNQQFTVFNKNLSHLGQDMSFYIDKDVFRLYTLCFGLLMGKTLIMSLVILEEVLSPLCNPNFLFFKRKT